LSEAFTLEGTGILDAPRAPIAATPPFRKDLREILWDIDAPFLNIVFNNIDPKNQERLQKK
jgi:hypothetical protein